MEYIWFSSFDFTSDENDNIGDELLDILTKFGDSLTDINISRGWKYSIGAFEQFFRKRTLPCHFLVTYHDKNYITKDHEAIIQEYINEGVIFCSECSKF